MANHAIYALTYGDTYIFTTPFGTCSTAAGTAAKTVATKDAKFDLEAGARIMVKFANANTAASPTLNVDSTGAKAIYYRGAAVGAKALGAGVYEFLYNGTQWEIIGDLAVWG